MIISYFFSKIKIINESDKPINLGNDVYEEKNYERKSWLFGRTCIRYLFVFLCQFLVIFLMLVLATVRIMFSTALKETKKWVATLSITVSYILLAPKL